MLKKIFTFFILIGFLITSQMQLVHAFDMGNMDIQSESQMSSHKSVFCVESNKWDTKSKECIQEVIPDKLLTNQKNTKIESYKITFFPKIVPFSTSLEKTALLVPFSKIDSYYRYRFKSKNSYQSLIGITTKKLN